MFDLLVITRRVITEKSNIDWSTKMIIELEDFLIEIQKFNRGNYSGLPASLVIFGDGSGYVQDGRG